MMKTLHKIKDSVSGNRKQDTTLALTLVNQTILKPTTARRAGPVAIAPVHQHFVSALAVTQQGLTEFS